MDTGTLALPLHVQTLGLPRGEAETFLLLHGYGGSSFSWRTWVPFLARRGHVVLVDMKGFGAAPRPDDGRYAPTDQAELVLRLIRERELRDLTLVGHSLGGGVALLTALRLMAETPGILDRLVIVAGAAYLQRMPPFVGLARRNRLAGALMRVLGAHFVVRQVLRTIVYDAGTITQQQVEGYANPLRGPDATRVLIETALQIVPPDLAAYAARYRTLDVPALLLWGSHDRVVPLDVGRRLVRELPRAHLAILARCGHLPAEERPEESLRLLEIFLDGSAPRAG